MRGVYFSIFDSYTGCRPKSRQKPATLTRCASSVVSWQRAVLLQAPFGGQLSSVTGEAWYKATTDRIDVLKVVGQVGAELSAYATGVATSGRQGLVISIAVSIGVLARCGCAFAAVITSSITRARSVAWSALCVSFAAGRADVALDVERIAARS